MTLPELIQYFRNDGDYTSFCKMQRLDKDAEAIEIYAAQPFGLNSKLEFLAIEETAGRTPYSYNGNEVHSLFDFYYFINAVNEAFRDETKSDIDIALRLLDYAERDA